jgi:plastocyanin
MGTANENTGNGQLLTIHKGDSVIWVTWDGAAPHTVTSLIGNPPTWDTGSFMAQSPPQPFMSTGSFPYQCSFHGSTSMKGVVTVQ